MTELKYVGTHQPFGMIVDVEESQVDKLLDSDDYEELIVKKVKKIIKPTIGEDDDSLF